MTPHRIASLFPIIGDDRRDALVATAAGASERLAGRIVLHVNSTATGGGVAEMLPTLVGYAQQVGVDARWAVVPGNPPFFDVTKRVHNRIHGHRGDDGQLGSAERQIYEGVLAEAVPDLLLMLHPGDVVVLHDPQTLGLAPMLHRAGIATIWRCHIGSDSVNAVTEDAWQFLAPYFDSVTAFVFSRLSYRPEQVPADRFHVITPSLDPLSAKNRPLPQADVIAVLGYTGLIAAGDGRAPSYQRRDGSVATMAHRADIIQVGPPVPQDEPLVVQVSRWDGLKDMSGVMTGFAEQVATTGSGHLILAGPNMAGVSDDPEGAAEFERCVHTWQKLPYAQRERVHLASLPLDDTEENATIVNALQRHATVVAQKSLAEGFGLTVVEAMWKGRPVVASNVGGIADQIDGPGCGVLLDDPTDLAAFGGLVRELLDDTARAQAIGHAAEARSRHFLPDLHLAKWAALIGELVDR